MRKLAFECVKTKTQINFAVTAKLISVFVFATPIVQSLYFLNPKFQASGYLLWLYSPVCNGPGQKPRRPFFSQQGSYIAVALGEVRKLSYFWKCFKKIYSGNGFLANHKSLIDYLLVTFDVLMAS